MREIIFRGKRADNGEWVEGWLMNEHIIPKEQEFTVECRNPQYFVDTDKLELYEIIPSTIGQYTGLTDKNGTKIFEGDILSAHLDDGYPEDITLLEVVWHNNGWYGKNEPFFDDFDNGFEKYFEVIGNAHDNPELLKE